MLYKKRNEAKLTNELFKNPTSEYRGTPFWAWNCELEKDELLWQIEELKKMGFGGAHIHCRSGMSTKYLSDGFMDLVKSCVEKFKEEDMNAYLYDEDKWASGYAGGYVTKNKKYREHSIKFVETPYEDAVDLNTALTTGKPSLLAVYDIVLDENGKLVSSEKIGANDEAKGTKRYAYFCTAEDSDWFNLQSYVDVLSEEAIKKFVQVTHERYKEVIGNEFGKNVNTIFTDEPQYSAVVMLPDPFSHQDVKIPYTQKFGAAFKKANGYDLFDKLADLVYESDTAKKTRYDYFNTLSEIFATSFSKTIGEWCDNNGIALTGHMMQEDNLDIQTRWIGEAMRHYKYFGIPGMDLLHDRMEFNTAKQVQSAVHQQGKEGMMSELYGVTDWDYDFRRHKFCGDWQAALGVTLRVPHLSWVSMKGSAKRDYPASINYQSAWYKEYGYVEDHFARVGTALTRGTPIVKVAVVHPIETMWINMGNTKNNGLKKKQIDKRFKDLTEWLLFNTIDFDFIAESELPVIETDFTNGFTVGAMTYDVVLVPSLETIRKTTLDALKEFAANGGRVVVVGDLPTRMDGAVSAEPSALKEYANVIPFDQVSVVEALSDLKVVNLVNENGTQTDNLIYALRRDGNDEWLFIAHGKHFDNEWDGPSIPHDQRIVINVKSDKTPVLYNTLNGEIYQIPFERTKDGISIPWSVYQNDSMLFKLTYSPEGKDITLEPDYKLNTTDFQTRCKEIFNRGVRTLDVVDYERGEDNALILDECEYRYDDETEYKDKKYIILMADDAKKEFKYPTEQCQPWVMKAVKPQHKITVKYDFYSDIVLTDACLATEDYERSTIYVNGKKLIKKSVGYFVDKSCVKLKLPKIQKGLNTVEITMPFGSRDNFEAVYITGDFNVKLEGARKTIVKKQDKIGYGNIVSQGMPFYGGTISYKTVFNAKEAGNYCITANYYRGALIKVYVDGELKGRIVCSPYTLVVNLAEGEHEIVYELFGNRHNCSGDIHNANVDTPVENGVGPGNWFTRGTDFVFEYVLKPIGIMASPIIEKID